MSDFGTDPRSPLSPARQERSERSIGAVLGDISKDLTTLMRQEVELAKAEAKQSATQAGSGLGLFAGAAVAGVLFLVFISVAAWWGLGDPIGRVWSGIIVGLIWAIIAVILAMLGRAQLKKTRGLPDTAETVKKIPPALKGQERPGDYTTGNTVTEDHR